MTKDYIRQSPPKKAKPTAKRKTRRAAPTAKKTRKPLYRLWAITAMTAALSTGFTWFLLSLTQTPPEIETQATAPAPIKKPSETQPEPTEKWTYIERLENQEVTVKVPPKKGTNAKPYALQCGSFRTESQAQTLKARIALTGLHSIIVPTKENPPRWYRVVLGPYSTKRHAERDRNLLKNNEIYGCQISFWKDD